MKIALVIFRANPALGGAEGYTANLAGALLERGHEVTFLAQSFGEGLPDGAQRVAIGGRGLTRLGKYVNFLDSLDAHLESNRYDIVHAMLPVRRCDMYHLHTGPAFEGVELGHLRHNNRFLRTLSRLGNRLNRKRLRYATVERELLSSPHPPMVLCLTEKMKATVGRRFPLLDGHLLKLFHGINMERFDPVARPRAGVELRRCLGIAEERIVAVTVAQDFELKGVPAAIAAIAAAADPRLLLLVVGRDNPASCRRVAERLKVADRVFFAGPAADVYPFYRAADFLLFPTRMDACGLVVLEATTMGLPVIVTRQAGASEAITHGREGFIVESPDDVPALTEAVRRLLSPELRRQMGAAGMALRPMLSQDHHIEELMRSYDLSRKSSQVSLPEDL